MIDEQQLTELTVMMGAGIEQRSGISRSRAVIGNQVRTLLESLDITVAGEAEELPEEEPLTAGDVLRALAEVPRSQMVKAILNIVLLMTAEPEDMAVEGNTAVELDYQKDCRSCADFFADVGQILENLGLAEFDVRRLVGK